MHRRRIMLVGATGCGKTALANWINGGGTVKERRTQDVIYGKYTIDIPGAYLECPDMYDHIISLAQNDAFIIIFIVDQNGAKEVYPPGFAKMFNCKVAGVISKIDAGLGNIRRCERQLKLAGVDGPYFSVSLLDGTGLRDLMDYLENVGVFAQLDKQGS
ncbi:MAG: EutP/PduV family microcompartment system protein [Eubacteriales bacterium]|jgi:ethanolamine utilization protein EutP|nr:EutP/PduV family microcompartment system protein [Eubacteriales bacterium]